MQYKLSVKEYQEALKASRLMGLKCTHCGAVTAPPRMTCRKCASPDLEVIQLSGKGKIVTYTTIRVPTENRVGQTPYIVVMVELEEGPWIMGNLSGIAANAASLELIDKKVEMITPPSSETAKEDGVAPLFVILS